MVLLKFYMQTKQWDKAITEARELQKPEYKYALVTDKGAERSAYANIFTYANEKELGNNLVCKLSYRLSGSFMVSPCYAK